MPNMPSRRVDGRVPVYMLWEAHPLDLRERLVATRCWLPCVQVLRGRTCVASMRA
jgi:hypothetical protein